MSAHRGTAGSVLVFVALAASALMGCSPALPAPDATLRAYAAAAERGDAAALSSLLTDESRKSLGRSGVERALADGKVELADQARDVKKGGWTLKATARVRYADGEDATLVLEDGAFRVASAEALPTAARTPVDALTAFRRVLSRRSYAGLLRVLSRETRAAMERDLSAIVDGLERPDALDVRVKGDEAQVELAGGHLVKLRREGGIWRIEDFD